MSAALDVLRLDVLTVRPFGRQLLLLLALAGVLGAVMGEPASVLPMTVVYAVLAASYPFAVADKNDLDTLYRVLPLARSSLLVGRYLFALALFVAAAVGGGLLVLVLSLADGALPAAGEAGLLLALAFALFGAMVATQYPVYVALGYMRARMVATLPFLVLVAVGVLLGDRLRPDRLPDLAVAVPALVAGTLALLGASLLVSVRLDARRVA